MFVKWLALVFLASLAVAKIPPYLKVCGRRNPNLEKCILESVEGLRGKLGEGAPELNLSPMEPLKVDQIPLINTGGVKSTATNVSIYGLTKFKLKSLHIDLEKRTLDTVMLLNEVSLDATYEIEAKVLVPIFRKGPAHIVAEELVSIGNLKWKMEKRHGVDYIYFYSGSTKMTIKDYKIEFEQTDGPDSPITQAINDAIVGGRREILDTMIPNLEKVITEEVLRRSNNIISHFTYDELFPDRE